MAAQKKKKKIDLVKLAQKDFYQARDKLWEYESLLRKKKEAESKYGKELSDLNRLIGELDQSILELPEGGLKTASIERRKELEYRKQNLAIRYPKGTECSEEYLLNIIEAWRQQFQIAKDAMDKALENEAKKIADAGKVADQGN